MFHVKHVNTRYGIHKIKKKLLFYRHISTSCDYIIYVKRKFTQKISETKKLPKTLQSNFTISDEIISRYKTLKVI